MSVRVSYKKQFILGVILFLIIIVTVEVAARSYEYFVPHCELLEKDVFKNVDYFLVKWICRDSRALQMEKQSIWLNAPNQYLTTININSYGFRGPEITKEKSENVFRIFFVGGSTAFGWGSTSDDTTISGFLQKKFNDVNPDLHVEVINAGIVGADSFRETYYIKNVLLEFEPDLFIIYDGWNDVKFWSSLPVIKKIEPQEEPRPFKFSNYPFYRTSYVIYKILFPTPHPEEDNPIKGDFTSEIISIWKKRFTAICELGKKEGFATLISVQPMAGSGNKTLTPDESRNVQYTDLFERLKGLEGLAESLNELKQTCEKTADLRGVFDDVLEAVYWDKIHVSDFGNEIVAQKLFELAMPLVLEKT